MSDWIYLKYIGEEKDELYRYLRYDLDGRITLYKYYSYNRAWGIYTVYDRLDRLSVYYMELPESDVMLELL